ncbi:MAG: hypothetical protein ACRD3J_24150, partial [Thermoanaerobaculia bacterium]
FWKALEYPLVSAILNRRTRRIGKGIRSVPARSLSYTSTEKPQPLTPLEEALLIFTTGITGVTMHDMPFQRPDGQDITLTLYLNLPGRGASSPDNVQMTRFFMINDEGTYFLRKPELENPRQFWEGGVTPEKIIELAERCKVQVLDHRLEYSTRDFPIYMGTNQYLSNLPGSTILVPVLDLSQYYINVLLYLVGQEAQGFRATWIDDWRFYRTAGVKKWEKNGFLSSQKTYPPFALGWLGTFRGHIEADLLIQNVLLMIQAMGLGGWIHASFPGPILLGSPETAQYGPGLGFRFHKPKKTLLRCLLKPVTPLPAWLPNPVGLDGLMEGYCPPYHKDMSAAVDAVVKLKEERPNGVYRDPKYFNEIFNKPYGKEFLREVPRDAPDVIAVVKDICNYIYDTYDRFPAHIDAMYVPGVWVQAIHT